jgi:hypothetical protein
MKIEKLENGIRFRAWVCRHDNYTPWEEGKPATKQGILASGPARLTEDNTGHWWGTDDDLGELAECCVVGNALLRCVKERKKRRVEITVRFV